MIYALFALLVATIIYQWVDKQLMYKQLERANHSICERWIQEREQWKSERQQLLDRIQAPSFDHLKQAEVRIIKAQKDETKKPEIEPV